MEARYLGLVGFGEALAEQQLEFERLLAGCSPGVILGFESERTITLGIRAREDADLGESSESLRRRGFSVVQVDRGGHATIHNPGQLVIFPVVSVRGVGARRWIEGLAEVTSECLRHWGIACEWDACRPGLYTARGKIMACGVRIRHGISTHGIAINVRNDLSDFALISACGVKNASLDRIGSDAEPSSVFAVWRENFQRVFAPSVDINSNLAEFEKQFAERS